MKHLLSLCFGIFLLASCTTTKISESGYSSNNDLPIIQSLFNDNSSSISEENIQKILDGKYELPENLRVAIVKLESTQRQRVYYWNDEQYLKAQQSYLDSFSEILGKSSRVKQVSVIPTILISNNPTFTNIRESAVRTQADIVVIYSITCDLYSKYKVFSSKTDLKAFATTQFVLLDVRTGLIPFSTIITKDYQSHKQKSDFDDSEAMNRVKNQAIFLTIEEIGEKLLTFLKKN